MNDEQIARGDFLPEGLPTTAELPKTAEGLPTTAELPKTAEGPPEPAEPEEEATAPRDEKGKFASKGIPKERFDQAVGKERTAREAAEQRVAALEARLAEVSQVAEKSEKLEEIEAQIDALTLEHSAFLLDGEGKKASDVMRKIRALDRDLVRAEIRNETRTVTAQVQEADRVELTIAKLEADHALLNPDSADYNAPLVNFILAEQTRLMRAGGVTPSAALSKAAQTVLEQFGPKAAPKEDPKGLAQTPVDRKAEAVKRNLAAQKAQPASMRDAGLDADKGGQTGALPDVSKLTREEYDALPEATRQRLRGDFVN